MEWISIIWGIAEPFLVKCLQSSSTEDPREFLKAHYNTDSDSFSGGVVSDALPQTYRAIRKARHQTAPRERKTFPQYSRDQVIQMTKDNLKKSMNAGDDRLAACKLIAKDLPDDDLSD